MERMGRVCRRRLRAVCFAAAALGVFWLAGRPADAGPAGNANPYSAGIAYAQERCVKLYGAGAGREHGYATGLLVSPEGHILTAHGIYLSGERLRAVLPDGSRHEATLLRRSDALQAALLKVDVKTPRYFELAAERVARPGDWVLAVSNAYNVAAPEEPLSVNLGIVMLQAELEARHRTQDVPYEGDLLLVDAITSNPGASGGALCAVNGRLAGMIGKLFQSVNTGTRLNYAVPVERLKRFVGGPEPAAPATPPDAPPRPVAGGATLGIRLFTLGGDRAPAYVDRVAAGSPAHDAGLRKDDLILTIGRTEIRTCRDFEEATKALPLDKPISILVKRGNTVQAFTLMPKEKKHEE